LLVLGSKKRRIYFWNFFWRQKGCTSHALYVVYIPNSNIYLLNYKIYNTPNSIVLIVSQLKKKNIFKCAIDVYLRGLDNYTSIHLSAKIFSKKADGSKSVTIISIDRKLQMLFPFENGGRNWE